MSAEINLRPVPEHIVDGVIPVTTVTADYQTPSLPVASSAPVTYTPIDMGPYAAQIRADDSSGHYTYGYVGE